jgi:3-phosphoshikimate 1-carboxyvinyltransferase
LTAASTLLPGIWTLTGTPRLAQRPLKPLIDALREAGAHIQGDALPLTIVGNPDWQPGRLVLRQAPTSQFASALLLLGWVLPLGTELVLPADRPSRAYEAHTHAFLLSEGVHWTPTETGYQLTGRSQTPPKERRVAGDWSAASYLLVPALFRRGQYTIAGLLKGSLQADERQLEWLQSRIATLAFTTAGLRVGNAAVQAQAAFTLDCSNNPDLAQTYAVAALGCRGTSLLTGLGTLPLKETDRLAALVTELRKTGAEVTAGPDWLRITPPERWPEGPLTFDTYDDHRMAMAFALDSLFHAPGVYIRHPEVVGKSFPDYWTQLARLGFRLNPAAGPPTYTSPQ